MYKIHIYTPERIWYLYSYSRRTDDEVVELVTRSGVVRADYIVRQHLITTEAIE